MFTPISDGIFVHVWFLLVTLVSKEKGKKKKRCPNPAASSRIPSLEDPGRLQGLRASSSGLEGKRFALLRQRVRWTQ